MMDAIFTYEFYLHDGKRVIGGVVGTETRKEARQPVFGGTTTIKCDLDNVDIINLFDNRPEPMRRIIKVFWNQEIFGPAGNPTLLKTGHYDLALIEFFEGQVFVGRSEPTIDDRIGLAIVTEKGRTLFTGVGDLLEIPAPVPYHQLIASLDLVYQFKAASPSGCAHIRPYVRKDKIPPQKQTHDGGLLPAS